MASKIEQYLNKILSSRFGKDVRQAIHDSIEQCYDDVTNPDLNTEAFETAVQNKIDDGSLALLTIPDGSITKEKLDPGLELGAQVDPTFSNEGEAADAKATGDAITNLSNKISDVISDKIVNELPVLYLYGDMSGMSHDDRVNLLYKFTDPDSKTFRTGWCDCKWQGDSSLSFNEKNYTIRFYHDAECSRKDKISYLDSVKESKWVAKANWIDASHARNIICARLWRDVVKSRHSEVPTELSDSPRYGAIDGRPIVIKINELYHGLYTLNISKDDFTYGMDEDNPLHCAVGGNYQGGTCEFRTTGIDSWEIEVPDAFPEGVKEKLTQMCAFVESSEDEEFYANLNNYLDVESVIDYYICAYFLGWADNLVKNVMLLTFDGGQKWYCNAYDMDCTLGNQNNISGFFGSSMRCPEDYYGKNSALWPRIEKLFRNELYNRYRELRDSVLSIDYVTRTINGFIDLIPQEEYDKDRIKWTGKANRNIDHREQMISWITDRAKYVDNEIANLVTAIDANSIKLNTSSYEFTSNTVFKLFAVLNPDNSTETITWESDNPEIATVNSDGVVTPVHSGSCTITAKTNRTNKTAECQVKVIDGLYDENTVLVKVLMENYTFNGTNIVFYTGYGYNEEYSKPLPGYDVIRVMDTECRIVFYDKEFKALSGKASRYQSLCESIPSNAKYFRISVKLSKYPSRIVPVMFYNSEDFVLSPTWSDTPDYDLDTTTGAMISGSYYVSDDIPIPEDANDVLIDGMTNNMSQFRIMSYNNGVLVNKASGWWNQSFAAVLTMEGATSVRFAILPGKMYDPDKLSFYYR